MDDDIGGEKEARHSNVLYIQDNSNNLKTIVEQLHIKWYDSVSKCF